MGNSTTKLLAIAFLLIPSLVYGAAIQGKEEGSVVGYCKSIDFVGGSQTLTASGLDCTLTSTADGGAGTGDVDSVGNCSSGACYDGTSDGGTNIVLYDAQGATTITVGDNSGVVALSLPNATGTLARTVDNVSTASALAADPANCASSGLAGGVTAAGVAEACITPNAGTNIANDLEEEVTEGSLADSTIVSADIKNGTIVVADTSITAGRSLTWSTDDLVADAELYTDTKCIYFEDPTADDDLKSIWFAKTAATITSLWCESDQTVTAMLQVDDGSAADVDGTDLTCDATPPEDTSLDGDATLASGDRLDLDVASVSGTPTWVSICFTLTYDD